MKVMKILSVQTFYLEMKQRPNGLNLGPPMDGCVVMRAKKPSVAFYKFLYSSVGKNWLWVDRLMMNDEELRQIIEDENIEIFVLYVDGVPVGYAELDRRIPHETEISYFGLMPEFIGRGLGRYLLNWIISKAWEYNPERLWLHTCELDHENALPIYIKSGFEIYKTETIKQKLPL